MLNGPNKGLQLTIDSWAFLSSGSILASGLCGMALTVSAVCCS